MAAGVFATSTVLGISAVNAETTSYEKVYFAPGSAKLSTETKKELRSIAKKYSTATAVDVTGYVQKSLSSSNDKSLAKARAKAVVKYLKARGMTAKFTYKGHGLPHKKKASAKSRRVTIELTTSSGSKVSGAFTSTITTAAGLVPLSVPRGLRQFVFDPTPYCASLGKLKVTLDGETDFISQEIEIANDCTADYSIPDVAPGTYKVVATIDLGTVLGNALSGPSSVTIDGWTFEVLTGTNTMQFTKTDLVVSADMTLDIKPSFTVSLPV